MKIILIDDEPIALNVLESMLSHYKEINIVGRYTNPMDALKEIETVNPDVIFIDIEMGKVSGLEAAEFFLEKINDLRIVFVTAYSEYAIDAFEINALDYLLKPVSEKRLDKTIKRLLRPNEQSTFNADKNMLRVQSFGGFALFDANGQPFYWRTRKTKELFAYLWFRSEHFVDRAVLMDAVFPDKNLKQSTALLHTTMYQLRNSLKKAGFPNPITYLNQGYRLDIPFVSDLKELKKLLKVRKPTADEMEGVLKIYKGEFMEEGYDWAILQQQNFKQAVFDSVMGFASFCVAKKEFGPLLKSCIELLYNIDPYDEKAAKLITIYFGAQNNKPELKFFYDRHAARLKDELGVDPPTDLTTLYAKYMS